jgi:galactokinase
VVSENARVAVSEEALRAGDLAKVGQLMNKSHESSRVLFENSCEELDFLAAEARNIPGCFGARLTGGGFGGAVLALVNRGTEDDFVKSISKRVSQTWGRVPQTLVTGADGA